MTDGGMKVVSAEGRAKRETSPPKPHGGNMVDSQAWSEKESAVYLGLSVKTLQARRAAHKAPPFLKVGRSVRYLKKDLDAFLAACRVDPERLQ